MDDSGSCLVDDKRLEIEDWLVVGAYILCMGIACTIIVATTFGMGSHINQGISRENITKLLKTLCKQQLLFGLHSLSLSL
ncbi:hypothetical protein TWF694_006209 [Orbilia ellipsospora]|uniref:Uncharacterized protein n=1 Tax=Orbilia ellipsospora TaxID=2528407 RepID=A0AAV9XKW4_9PEZI